MILELSENVGGELRAGGGAFRERLTYERCRNDAGLREFILLNSSLSQRKERVKRVVSDLI